MRKKLVCHPNNLEILKQHVKDTEDRVNKMSDLFMPFGYEIVADASIPEKEPTGKVIFKKDRFVDYSEPANLNMHWQDYVDMCVYFGWAELEYEMVFYEVDYASLKEINNLAFDPSVTQNGLFKGITS